MSMLSFRFLCLAIATSASDNHVSTTNPDHTKLFGSKLRKENAIWNSVRGMESSFVSDSDRHAPYQRRIQQQQQQNVSLNYWAKYTAQFQSREHIACESPPPALKVYCRGPDLQILAVSDPSIVCQSNGTADAAGRLPVNSDGFTHIECASTCASSTECANVHLILDGTTSNEDNSKNSTQKTSRRGPTGEIQFQCGGESLADVDAAVSLEQIGNGQCDKLEGVLEELAEKEEEKEEEKNESANAFRTTQIVQFLRLGVVCPLENTTVFDDFYFECTPDSLTYLDPYSNDNHYICAEARNCNGSSCTTNSSSLLLNSDSRQFRTCIESARPIPPPAASSAPAPPSNTDNNSEKVWILSAKFEASWSLLFDPLSADDCNAFTPTVRLECSNGNDIQFLDSTTNSVNCTALFNDSNAGRNSAMICIDTDSFNFVDKFTSITYVSTTVSGRSELESNRHSHSIVAVLSYRNVQGRDYRRQIWDFSKMMLLAVTTG